ncbi:uncharacterized protein LOC128956990 [Oppia nitens]|uniref:uncharacterized protein LOC128956990 n=1 Tax=Oppia nitens TaxID=1686743 RepID=UPI0023DA37C0|nr:uncharacterized protein LOC128956990 [Oppia nitens]
MSLTTNIIADDSRSHPVIDEDMDITAADAVNDGQHVVNPTTTTSEQLPSIVKSHLPPHLQRYAGGGQQQQKQPLRDSTTTGAHNPGATVPGSTPAMVKRRQMTKWFNSPTDAFLSPCTQKLWKPKHPTTGQSAIGSLDLDSGAADDEEEYADAIDSQPMNQQ